MTEAELPSTAPLSTARQIAAAFRTPPPPAFAVPPHDPDWAAFDRDWARAQDIQHQMLDALIHRPMHGFSIDSLVVVDRHGANAVIRVRIGGQVWRLDTIEAACFAIIVRLSPDLRGADLFADAFSLASREAEAKLEGLHRFGQALAIEDRG